MYTLITRNIPDGKVGYIIGRNGEYSLHGVELYSHGPGQNVKIDGLNRRGKVIRGGLSIPESVMDEIAKSWLKARGILAEDESWYDPGDGAIPAR